MQLLHLISISTYAMAAAVVGNFFRDITDDWIFFQMEFMDAFLLFPSLSVSFSLYSVASSANQPLYLALHL